jgi:ketosteroid isomerase-like protein
MSRENVETARQWADVWNTGGVDAWVRLLPSDFEWHDAANLPDARIHRGREAVAAHLREMVEAGGQFPIDVEEQIDAGDQVFSAIRLHVRGPRSGVAVSQLWFQVTDFRDGRPVRMLNFQDRAEALAAAGLSEQDARTRASSA